MPATNTYNNFYFPFLSLDLLVIAVVDLGRGCVGCEGGAVGIVVVEVDILLFFLQLMDIC